MPVQPAILKIEVAKKDFRGRDDAPPFFVVGRDVACYVSGGKAEEKRLSKASNDAKPKEPGSAEWAAAVVRKATPSIVESLMEAVRACGVPQAKCQCALARARAEEEHKDEPLAALLLRLLRAPAAETDSGQAATESGEKPTVG